jgi:tRNA(Met) C34 N-acetyltransferase TmcA
MITGVHVEDHPATQAVHRTNVAEQNEALITVYSLYSTRHYRTALAVLQ